MYAIVEISDKQHKVEADSILDVAFNDGKVGATLTYKNVLLISDGKKVTIGQPYVKNVTVNAEIVAQHLGKKIIAFTYRKRKDSKVKKGHRQKLTKIKIVKIETK